MLIMAGMVGTTMGAILYVVRSILVQEKGWERRDLKAERRDAIVSVSMMFILSVAVMAAAAGTLHPLGLKVDNAIDMVKLMEPLAGQVCHLGLCGRYCGSRTLFTVSHYLAGSLALCRF